MIRPALIAGVLSGIAGLAVFLVVHALWILPIWFIAPPGLILAGAGGLAVGWAYAEMLPRLPRRPWTAPAVVGLIAAILAPAVILAQLRAPLFAISGMTGVLVAPIPVVVARFVLELLASVLLVGGLIGWWLGRTRRAALATALAGFIFALGPGHNIPIIGGTPSVGKEIAIMTAIVVVSALVLVETHAWLSALEKPAR